MSNCPEYHGVWRLGELTLTELGSLSRKQV